jgi:hypothetical protein
MIEASMMQEEMADNSPAPKLAPAAKQKRTCQQKMTGLTQRLSG